MESVLTEWERRALWYEAQEWPSDLHKYDAIRNDFHGSLVQYAEMLRILVKRVEAQKYLEHLREVARARPSSSANR